MNDSVKRRIFLIIRNTLGKCVQQVGEGRRGQSESFNNVKSLVVSSSRHAGSP
jgi:hypothetical protein